MKCFKNLIILKWKIIMNKKIDNNILMKAKLKKLKIFKIWHKLKDYKMTKEFEEYL